MNDQNDDKDDSQRIDAIRDILFGQEMRQFDQRFAALEQRLQARLDENHAASRRELAGLGEALAQQRAELITELTDQLAALQQRSIDRSDLARMLRELADQLDAG